MRHLLTLLAIMLVSNLAYGQGWETVRTLTGNGIKNTGAFTISDSEWRITYESESSGLMDGAGHIFQLYLRQPNDNGIGEILANQVNKQDISGTSNVYKSGRFYFQVNAANGDWKIRVQVYRN